MPKRCRAVLHRHPVVVGALVFSLMFASVGLSLAIPASAQPGQTDPSQSTISASPLEVPADGQTASTITVTLVDDTGTAVVGDDVSVTDSTGNSSCTSASPCTAVSNGSGKAQVQVVDSTVESDVFSAVDTTQNVSVEQTASVQFATPGSQVSIGQINSAACTDSLHCWIVGQTATIGNGVGQSLILATTNGGTSWMSQTLPPGLSGYQLDHIFCLPNTQDDCWIAADLSGDVLATTDGINWQAYQVDSTDVAGIACANALHCWASDGRDGGVYGSTDGGHTWTLQYGPLGYGMPAVACADDTHCWAFGGDGSGNAVILATTDGSTWSQQTQPPGVLKLNSAVCLSDTLCWAAGGNPGTIVETTDGGNTWTTQLMVSSAMGDNFFEGISCLSSTYCWAVGGKFTDEAYDGANNGYVYRWDGNTWTQAEVPTSASVFSVSGIACPNMATCLATGYYANGASVIDYGVSSNGTANAGVNDVNLTATGGTDGADSVSEAQYGPDPVGTLQNGNNFFDVALSDNNTFSGVVVQDCNGVTPSSSLNWWDPSANSGSGGWEPVVGNPGPSYEAGSPSCLSVTLDSSTSPTPSELTGTVLGTASANSSVSQTISWPSEPTSGVKGGSVTLSATGGGSDNPVVYKIDSTSGSGVCSVSGTNGKTLSYTGIGTCVVDANQAGNSGYSAAPQVQDTFSVTSCSDTATRCFTSAPSHSASVGSQFSFPVTTAGSPTPKITEKGKLPKGVTFNKTTDIVSGTPTSTKHKAASGTYSLTFTARFGKGKNKVVVTQSFLLTVT